MPKIKRNSIDDLRARVNLVDVVGPYVTLKRAGAKWKGLSPFATEKTPSFFVDPQKNLYYCFSTGQGGDIFKFVQAKENLGFQEAAEALAQRFGVVLEYEDDHRAPEAISQRKELLDLHETAAAHFHAAFLRRDDGGEFIRRYWTESRRFPPELAAEFKIGWAAPDGGGLLDALLKKRYAAGTLFNCGLFFYREGSAGQQNDPARGRPRFRGRLMIPIRDVQGRVIAFTARQTERTPADDPAREAKYVNSPETPLFRKGEVLFNLDRAHAPVREAGRFVMVEGQLDALRCWSAGVTSVIAPQGTAITENQLILLRRYAGRVDCLLDGDAAGQRAALRVLPLALKTSLEIRFLPLPPETDPDELFLAKGAAALAELDRQAESAMSFAMRMLLPSPEPSESELRAAFRALYEIIAQCDSPRTRLDYLDDALRSSKARSLLLHRGEIEREFNEFLRRAPARPQPADSAPAVPAATREASPMYANSAQASAPGGPTSNDKLTTAEYELLMYGFHYEHLAPSIAQLLENQWIDTTTWEGRLLDRCLAAHREDVWPGADHLEELFETEEERQVFSDLRSRPFSADTDEPIKAINECLKAIFEKHFRRELAALKTRVANTPITDQNTIAALVTRIKEVQQILKHPPRLEAPPN